MVPASPDASDPVPPNAVSAANIELTGPPAATPAPATTAVAAGSIAASIDAGAAVVEAPPEAAPPASSTSAAAPSTAQSSSPEGVHSPSKTAESPAGGTARHQTGLTGTVPLNDLETSIDRAAAPGHAEVATHEEVQQQLANEAHEAHEQRALLHVRSTDHAIVLVKIISELARAGDSAVARVVFEMHD